MVKLFEIKLYIMIFFDKPTVTDAKSIYELVKNNGTLESNTEYAYLLLATHFASTCCVVRRDGEVVGAMLGYLVPDTPDTLFVWQIGVSNQCQGQGLARGMILDVLGRENCKGVCHVQATVSESNTSSRALFSSLARYLGCPITVKDYFEPAHFIQAHEAEPMLSIGPFKSKIKGELNDN